MLNCAVPTHKEDSLLTPRWTPLWAHDGQLEYWTSPARFNCVSAGRRSGKSERAKRKLVKRAHLFTLPDGRFIYCAPTRQQAKDIAWQDLKDLCPKQFVLAISETELTIHLVNGSKVIVAGMDKPQRIEGKHIDGCVIDEMADMKPGAFGQTIRPALSTLGRPPGWCDFIGKPRGRNHWYDRCEHAKDPENADWRHFSWHSNTVIDPEEDAAARADLDELTYLQEYAASFVNFQGRAYYTYNPQVHGAQRLEYDPRRPLIFAFDFNVDPGVAAIGQDLPHPDGLDDLATCWIGEVYIPRNSNTPAVCRKLVQEWKKHSGEIRCYGDATGGARGTAKTEGSDWDLIRRELRNVPGWDVRYRVKKRNPPERARVNAVNTRFMTKSGVPRMFIDPWKCPKLARDFEGVQLLEGGSGEIDKKHDSQLTHLSDAVGYFVDYEYPIQRRVTVTHSF